MTKRSVLAKSALLDPQKRETFSSIGPYKFKELYTPGGSSASSHLVNLVKTPLKKSPEDLAQVDPLSKMLHVMMLMQLAQGGQGGKALLDPAAVAPMLGLQYASDMEKQKTASSPSRKTLAELAGQGGVETYAQRILKELKPEHYSEAGAGNTEEVVKKLVEEIIPRTIMREHAARIGRGNVQLGQRLLEEHLAPSFHDTGETVPRILSRLLTGHVSNLREADKHRALLDINLDAPAAKADKKPSVREWLSVIEKNAPKPEQDPYRAVQRHMDDAGKYGSVGAIPGREDVLRHYLQKIAIGGPLQGTTFGSKFKRFITHPLTLGLGVPALISAVSHYAPEGSGTAAASAAGSALGSTWDWATQSPSGYLGLPALGLAGALGGAALRRHMAPDEINLGQHKVSPFYTPADGGKARALNVTPDMLQSVVAESPQVSALVRAAGPETLQHLSRAAVINPGAPAWIGRFLSKFTGSGRQLRNADTLLRQIIYATHGDASTPEKARAHLSAITGQQGRRAGEYLADVLHAGAGHRGALGSTVERSGLGNLKVTDDFTDQVQQLLLNRLQAQTPLSSVRT